MVISRSWVKASGYDFTLGDVELEKSNSLRILGITLDSKLTCEIHLREVVSKAAKSLGVMSRAEKVFDCPRILKSCFNAYISCPD